MKSDKFILYGLNEYKQTIDKIISDLNVHDDQDECFDIRLILTESLTNAFKHGNKGREDKPIYLRYTYDGVYIKFEIEDTGTGYVNVNVPDQVMDENMLNDCGRGLFLIKSIADRVELINNKMIIQKALKSNNFFKVS